MKYQVQATDKRTGKTLTTDEPTIERAESAAWTRLQEKRYKTIVILQDQEGADHPDNAGKYFLHRIVK